MKLIILFHLVQKLSREISKKHKANLPTVVAKAKGLAARGLPANDAPSIEPLLVEHRGFYMSLKSYISLCLKGRLQTIMGKVSLDKFKTLIANCFASIKIKREEIHQLHLDKNALTATNRGIAPSVLIMLFILLGLGDVSFNISLFINLNEIFLIALIIGTVVGIAQMLLAKTCVVAIRDSAAPQHQRVWFIALTLGFAIISVSLGATRYHFLDKTLATNVWVINPFLFAIINLLLVGASGALAYYYWPTNEVMHELLEKDRIDKQIAKKEKEIKRLETQITELEHTKNEVIALHGQLIHDEATLHQQINADFDHAVGTLMSEIIQRRSDGILPACFLIAHEPLEPTESFFSIN